MIGYRAEGLAGNTGILEERRIADGVALAVTAVRTVSGGNDKSLYIIGGWRLDQNFLAALVLPRWHASVALSEFGARVRIGGTHGRERNNRRTRATAPAH